ncbi:histidine phosphatase family protein [Acuticoccus sp. MNP-M23]|uniref:SixA phosphatase family protein n=1 Tax=Acuticoccus sp. MNP-M23 TaxID=3072793 RepID=UPI002815FFB7|nr:histidine phosphatase family protein [Acuticoccus sp. MNP-M23]WMS44468.1 histidine phosphatase family protein [Acuticoccus sp. MNP-M23]
MRRLIIMRHARAEAGSGKPDFDRMLDPRGWHEAGDVGAALAEAGLLPDMVLCSAARRTRDTLAAIMPHLSRDCTIRILGEIYNAEPPALCNLLGRASGQTILLIGHNPTVHSLALDLAGENAGKVGNSFPTSTAAVFTIGAALDTADFKGLLTP